MAIKSQERLSTKKRVDSKVDCKKGLSSLLSTRVNSLFFIKQLLTSLSTVVEYIIIYKNILLLTTTLVTNSKTCKSSNTINNSLMIGVGKWVEN